MKKKSKELTPEQEASLRAEFEGLVFPDFLENIKPHNMESNIKDGKILAPFTPEQVVALNKYQENGTFHPFTCGGENCNRSEREDDGVLLATKEGWICGCGKYKQLWAHEGMV